MTNAFRLRHEIDLATLCVDGERVRLRSIHEHYADSIFSEFNEAINEFILSKPADTITETYAFIESSLRGMKRKDDLVFVILNKDDEEFLGCCGLHGGDHTQTPELGIWIKKSAHGQKLGREAIAVACRWALKHLDFDYLIYPVDRKNIPSRKIPESMGGVIIEEKRVPTWRGTELDEVVFKLTPEVLAGSEET